MRVFDPKSDPLLTSPVDLAGGWRKLDGMGLTANAGRLIIYVGIVALLGVFMAPFSWGEDPLQGFAALASRVGGKTVLVASILFAVVAMTLIHEALHVLVHPDHGLSDDTVVGLGKGAVFTMFTGVMSRDRFLVCLLTPLFVIGAAIIAVAVLAPSLRLLLLQFAVLHVGMSLGDIVLASQLIMRRERFQEVKNCGSCLVAR